MLPTGSEYFLQENTETRVQKCEFEKSLLPSYFHLCTSSLVTGTSDCLLTEWTRALPGSLKLDVVCGERMVPHPFCFLLSWVPAGYWCPFTPSLGQFYRKVLQGQCSGALVFMHWAVLLVVRFAVWRADVACISLLMLRPSVTYINPGCFEVQCAIKSSLKRCGIMKMRSQKC